MRVRGSAGVSLVVALALSAAGCGRVPEASEPVRSDVALYLVDDSAAEGGRTVAVLRPYPGQPPRVTLQPMPAVARGQVARVAVGKDGVGGSALELQLSEAGAQRLARVTRDNVGKRMAVVMGATAVSVSTIQSEIPGGRLSIGGLDLAEAQALHRELVAGR